MTLAELLAFDRGKKNCTIGNSIFMHGAIAAYHGDLRRRVLHRSFIIAA